MSRIVAISRQLAANLGDIIATRPDNAPDPSAVLQGSGDTGGATRMSPFDQWLKSVRAPGDRVREMRYYDYLEREVSDVRKALDAYATMAVTGNLAGGGRSTYTIRTVDDSKKYPEALLQRLKRLETLIQRNAYSTIRNMVKYGTYVPEIVPGELPGGGIGITRMRAIPPGTMFRNVGKNGEWDPKKYWIQVIDGRVVGPQGANDPTAVAPAANGLHPHGFPQWMLPHFAIWSNTVNATETLIYGTSLMQPVGAIALKVHASLDAITVARLSRAAMRYVWHYDVSDIRQDQAAIQRRGRAWQRMVSRQTNLLDGGESSDSYQKAPVPDADFFLPAATGLAYKLDTLDGDTNLARTADVELLCRFYFGALGMPPEYLGHERSQGGRSNLSQVDIQFARTVRHIQLYGAAGFEHMIWVDMLLGGFNPNDWPIECVPPPIGARDDLLQAQIRALQASVVGALRAAGLKLELAPRWVLQTFLQLDEELESLPEGVLDKIFEAMPMAPDGPAPTPSDQKRARELMQAMDPSLLLLVKENLRFAASQSDPMSGLIHRWGQPSIEDLQVNMIGE